VDLFKPTELRLLPEDKRVCRDLHMEACNIAQVTSVANRVFADRLKCSVSFVPSVIFLKTDLTEVLEPIFENGGCTVPSDLAMLLTIDATGFLSFMSFLLSTKV
jgi:hypothetical protein